MKTNYYPSYYSGDTLYSPITGAFTIAKHGVRVPDYHVTSTLGVTYSEMDLKRTGVRLLRRADEPEFPAGLPPLPDAPKDHHFVYRGTRWKAKGVVYAYSMLESRGWRTSWRRNDACGMEGHYAELVPNEPYTPSSLRKLAEHLLTLTPEQREAEGFEVKDCATKAECFGNTGTLSPDPQLDHLDSRSLERDGVEFHGHPGVRSLEFRSSVRVTPKTPYFGVSPEVAAMLQKYELPTRIIPSFEWARHMNQNLEGERRYLVLTIDQAVAEFEAGACVFHVEGEKFYILTRIPDRHMKNSVSWRTHLVDNITRDVGGFERVYSLKGAIKIAVTGKQKYSEDVPPKQVYVTDSRKNLKHFHSATEKL